MSQSHHYDIVVVGAGNAGIPAAVEAATHGARVLLVEKDTRIGGTLHSTGGHLSAAGTAIQRRNGIDDSVEEHLADIKRIAHDTYREDLMTLAISNAAETVDWLDVNGFRFDQATPRIVYGHEAYTTPRTYYGPDAGLSILEVLKPLLDDAIASAGVTLWTDTPVVGLVPDPEDDTVIRSVLVLRRGEELEIDAKYVVLASGGFANDPELFAELENAPLVSAAHPTSTGDGLVMARDIGAGLQGREGRYLPAFGGLPHPTTPGRVQWTDRPLLSAQERLPSEIYVDRTGARWVAEDEPSIDVKERALADITDLTFWMVLDSVGLQDSKPLVVGWSVEDVQAKANHRAGIFAADSLDALAEVTGIDATGLAASVARYNDFVSDGLDPDFGRTHLPSPIATPPFYALENHGIALITFVGLDCDEQLRIRREDGTTFDNLYGVGEVLGSRAVHGFAYLSGMTVTTAITFGRLIGTELGERVSRSS